LIHAIISVRMTPARPQQRLVEGKMVVFRPDQEQIILPLAGLFGNCAVWKNPGLFARRAAKAGEQLMEEAVDSLAGRQGSSCGRIEAAFAMDWRTRNCTDAPPVLPSSLPSIAQPQDQAIGIEGWFRPDKLVQTQVLTRR
jgi:hypothetical protein